MIVQPASLGPRTRPRRLVRALALAVPVVLLAVVVAAGILGPAPAPPRSPAPSAPAVAVVGPSRSPGTADDPLAPSAVRFPSTVAGLEVHGLRWVLEARNRGLARGVIAVAGFLGMEAIPDECTDARLGIFGSFCDRDAVLTEDPWFGGTLARPDPPGFHLHPQFPVGVQMPSQATFVAVSPGTETPPVVLLGRFGDARARACVPGGRHCGQEFVVERVAWVDGDDYATTPGVDPLVDTPALTRAELRAGATTARGALDARSFLLYAALLDPSTIARLDPAIAAAAGRLDPGVPVWVVRGLLAPGDPTHVDWAIVPERGGPPLAIGSLLTIRGPSDGS